MFRRPSRYTMMMLFLLGGAASLIGIIISSAATTYHFFGVVAGQGQQPIQSQKLGQQILSPQQKQLSAQQIKQDNELVDRIFPYIIERIDGKTLAQKIDVGTLLQKMNDKVLAVKVLPYLEIKVVTVERPGPEHHIDISGLAFKTVTAKASCAPDESLVGGGFRSRDPPSQNFREHFFSPDTRKWVIVPDTKTWAVWTMFKNEGYIQTYAECLKVELGLNPTYQAPGGPPLQPPPEFGK